MPVFSFCLWALLLAQSSVLITAQAPASVSTSPTSAPPLDPKLFEPTNRTTGLLNPNPVNPTCEVLLDIKTVNTTGPAQQQPSASQVASSVQSNISMQIANLNATEFETGFNVSMELPESANVTRALNATVGPRSSTGNGTATFQMTSALPLPAKGNGSQILNTTVISTTQDVTPRNVFLNGTRCALALNGQNPTNLPPTGSGSGLFNNLQNPSGK